MKKKTTKKGFDAGSNKEFAEDMKKAFKGKKKKSSNPLDALMNVPRGKKKQPMQMPMQNQMAQAPQVQQPMMKKSKTKSSTKKKVSHVLQESSKCKMCKTSHPAGKHSKKSKTSNDHDADDKKSKGTKKKY